MNQIISQSNNYKIDVDVAQLQDGVSEYTYQVTFFESPKKIKESITIAWKKPYLDVAGVWHPKAGLNKFVFADYVRPFKSMTTISGPVISIFSEDSKNRGLIALSEIKEEVFLHIGIREEDGMGHYRVEIPSTSVGERLEYTFKLRVDERDIAFEKSIMDTATWWEETCEITPMEVTGVARDTMYSTWYSYHQNLFAQELEEQAMLAKEIGCKAIIVDDGWQTDDNNRGYAFCGDWEVSTNRFPDFAAHVAKVHEIGLQYILWYSVPFMGYEAKSWKTFEDKLLYKVDNLKCAVLDPRYKEVREYLIGIYENAIKDWGIDGFKLDFVDNFYQAENTPEYNEEMDFESVQDAADFLFTEISDRLKKLKPDVLIEFRQNYIGPNMRKYGNLFRVVDCPNSAINNRVAIVDLRVMSGNTAVHSDMLMWHKDESAELASIQIISSIFATLQLSVKLENISEAHMKMLRFWIEFMREHKQLLQESELSPLEPHNQYPEVWAHNAEKAIVAVYTNNRVLEIPKDKKEVIILNGTKTNRTIIELTEEANYEVIVQNCKGEVLSKTEGVLTESLHVIPSETGSVVTIRKS